MINTPQTPPASDKGLDIMIENCERSIAFSHWALGLGLQALAVPNAEFAAAVRRDPGYARTMVEVYKMMLIDQGGAAMRTRVAALALERIRQALGPHRLMVVGDPLQMRIDYSLVPLARGIKAKDINSLRPDVSLLFCAN